MSSVADIVMLEIQAVALQGDRIIPQTHLQDIMDSLDMAELQINLEQELQIEIDIDSMMQCVTVSDLFNLVTSIKEGLNGHDKHIKSD